MLTIDIAGMVGTFPIEAKVEGGMGVTALYGRSGAGKSSLLRAVAGLWTPERGRISIGDTVLFDSEAGVNVPVHKRKLGVVFQAPLLFPNMSVERNLRYAFDGNAEGVWQSTVAMLDLGALLNRRPRNLSGGEQQRVALGRALLAQPRILLLDEPMTGLDDYRRAQVMPYLQAIRDTTSVPVLYVSHHREEIAELADLIFLMENGRVTAEMTPTELLAYDLTGQVE